MNNITPDHIITTEQDGDGYAFEFHVFSTPIARPNCGELHGVAVSWSTYQYSGKTEGPFIDFIHLIRSIVDGTWYSVEDGPRATVELLSIEQAEELLTALQKAIEYMKQIKEGD